MAEQTGEQGIQNKAGTRVVIGVPCGDQVATWFAYDYGRLIGYTAVTIPDCSIQTLFVQGTLIGPQRDAIVEKALEWDATHILWLDSDMRFPKNTLHGLLQHEADIVGANYCKRMPPYTPTAVADKMQVYTYENSTGLVPVDHLGMGVMLTKTGLFRKMKKPMFPIGWDEENGRYIGEDVAFQRKARLLGYTVYCDQELSKMVQHTGTIEFTFLHALDAAEIKGQADKGVAEHGADNDVRDASG